MTILTLRFREQKIKDYALVRGESLTIGRNPDNHIVIDSMSVSGNHARVESAAADFIIRDLDSTNGTFVNNQLVKLHVLQHKDVIMIGKHELVFDRLVFDRSARLDMSQENDDAFFDDKTRFLDTRDHRELIRQPREEGVPDLKTPETQQANQGESGLFARLCKKLFAR